jgi:hypothetical protein
MRMKSLTGISCLLVLAGCASAPPESTATEDTEVCERYYPTGSNIARMRCFTAEEQRQQQQAVEEMRNAINRTTTTTGGARTGQ